CARDTPADRVAAAARRRRTGAFESGQLPGRAFRAARLGCAIPPRVHSATHARLFARTLGSDRLRRTRHTGTAARGARLPGCANHAAPLCATCDDRQRQKTKTAAWAVLVVASAPRHGGR